MKLRRDEYLKLTMLDDENGRILDIRAWKKTPTGGMPTRKSFILSARTVVPLIIGLQKIHRDESEVQSRFNSTEATPS